MAKYIEREFHKTIWNAANEWQEVEQALIDARKICYLAREHDGDTALTYAVNHWLDRFGRNALREGKNAKR